MTREQHYLRLRGSGWPAGRGTLETARRLAGLDAGEADGRVLVRILEDCDYEPDGDYDLAEEARAIAAGELEAVGVLVFVPDPAAPTVQDDPSGDPERSGWMLADSLWGVVAEPGDPYPRIVAAESYAAIVTA